MITLTENAAKEVKQIIKEMNQGEKFLRVSAKAGGCQGFKFDLDFDSNKTDKDELSTQHEVNIVVDKRSITYLEGVTLDFQQDISKRGFVFETKENLGRCSCGKSFSM